MSLFQTWNLKEWLAFFLYLGGGNESGLGVHDYRIAYVVDDGSDRRAETARFFGALGISAKFINGGGALIDRMNGLKPGCVILDMDVSGINSFEILHALAARRAHLPVIVVSSHGDIATVVRVMQLGACDFLRRPLDAVSLTASLARVFDRLAEDVLTYERQQRAIAKLDALTDRENDVLHGLVAGLPNKTLAHDLGLSTRTVEMHRANLMNRLGVRNLAQALRLAFDAGIDLEVVKDERASGEA